jgi:hypothetical protein
MIHYILLGIFLLFITISLYIKIKFKFWSYQPVFHFYNLLYWIHPPGIINEYLPEFNKFTNLQNVKTQSIVDLKKHELKQTVYFIKQHYLQSGNIQFNPTYKYFMSYFNSQLNPSYISFYTEPQILIDYKNKDSIQDTKTLGVITSRPLYITHHSKTFMISYVDYLCIHNEKRKKGIAPELIQTHIYNQSNANKVFDIYFFKRETKFTGIVPFVAYKTYGFELEDSNRIGDQKLIFNQYHLIEITKKNMRLFLDFMKKQKKTIILPCLSNIYELIRSDTITLYAFLKKDVVQCLFMFQNTHTLYNKSRSISLNGSLVTPNISNTIFLKGFALAYKKAMQKYKGTFLFIEDISDNDTIIKNIQNMSKPFMVSPTAYFFYNYATRTIESKELFIMC